MADTVSNFSFLHLPVILSICLSSFSDFHTNKDKVHNFHIYNTTSLVCQMSFFYIIYIWEADFFLNKKKSSVTFFRSNVTYFMYDLIVYVLYI